MRPAGHTAGRIGRKIQVNQARVAADQRRQLFGGQGKTVVFPQVNRHRPGAHVGDVGFIQRVTRGRVDDLVAALAVGLLGEADGRPGPGEHHHALRIDLRQPAILGDLARQGSPQFRHTLGIAVCGLSRPDGVDHRFGDVGRQRKVRLAQVAANHALAVGPFDFRNARPKAECGLCTHQLNPLGEELGVRICLCVNVHHG